MTTSRSNAGILTKSRHTISGGTDRVRNWWAGAPKWQRWLVYIALIIGALLLPASGIGSFMTPQSDWATVLFYPIGVYIALAIGLNVVVGYAGLLDLGYVAFFAIGGYSMAILGTMFGWSFWEILIVGVLATSV
jgi:branched-chain amino acid transport system permease protein